MKISRLLRRIRSDFAAGENIDAYVAALLGGTFTVLGVFGNLSQQWLTNFVLLTLTFLIVISLKNRYSLQGAEKLFQLSSSPDASSALKDRADYDPLDDRLAGAREVIVVGQHLLGFVGFNRDAIRKYAKQGCIFKFVVVDPRLEAPPQFISRGDIERSILVLAQIGAECPNKIFVRTTREVLPCAVFAVDMDKPQGLIQIQPHPLFRESDLRAHYDLRASNNSRWYGYYKEQIELLWDNSAVYLPQHVNK